MSTTACWLNLICLRQKREIVKLLIVLQIWLLTQISFTGVEKSEKVVLKKFLSYNINAKLGVANLGLTKKMLLRFPSTYTGYLIKSSENESLMMGPYEFSLSLAFISHP